MKTTMIVAALVAAAAPATAQTSAYAAEAPREIAALSAEEVSSLLNGAGIGFARAAELNGVPGPRHALDMAAELHLDDAQHARLEDIFARMQGRARELGAAVVSAERELDALFASGTPTAEEVERRTLELGRLTGELRAVHLRAHLETAAVLDTHQVARYSQLRGYTATEPGAAAAEHGAHH